jgi:hypothetical protein
MIGYKFTSNSTKFKGNLFLVVVNKSLKNFPYTGIFTLEISNGVYFFMPHCHLIDETNKIRHATICLLSLERNFSAIKPVGLADTAEARHFTAR